MRAVTLGGSHVGIGDIVTIARERAPVDVAAGVIDRLERAHAVVDRAAGGDLPIYGLNSALGANTGAPLSPDDHLQYQVRAVRARAVGVGPPLPEDRVRAAMAVRVAGMAQGGSGVSIAVFRSLVDALNRGFYPHVPGLGSIGVADLPQLSHIALALLGEGEAFAGGKRVAAREALLAAGLAPVALAGKDGLALISSNACTVGHACLVLSDLEHVLTVHDRVIALSFEGFRGNLSPLEVRAQAARPAPGQTDAAARIVKALDGSGLLAAGAARRVQDPLSFRCVAQVQGAMRDAHAQAASHVAIELNTAADSPLVDAAAGTLLSTGNFHVPGLAIAHEALGLALAQVATLTVERCLRLLSPSASGLPLQLTRHGPQQSGLRDRAETADGARQRNSPPRASGVPRFPARFREHRRPRDDGPALRGETRPDARASYPSDRDRGRHCGASGGPACARRAFDTRCRRARNLRGRSSALGIPRRRPLARAGFRGGRGMDRRGRVVSTTRDPR